MKVETLSFDLMGRVVIVSVRLLKIVVIVKELNFVHKYVFSLPRNLYETQSYLTFHGIMPPFIVVVYFDWSIF